MKVYTCFPGGKAKALTMSYDDGKLQDKRLIGIFNKYGIKAEQCMVDEKRRYQQQRFYPAQGL